MPREHRARLVETLLEDAEDVQLTALRDMIQASSLRHSRSTDGAELIVEVQTSGDRKTDPAADAGVNAKARRIYHARRDHLAELLIKRFSNCSEFALPAGGLAIWLRLNPGLHAETWAMNAANLGLSLLPGVHFTLNAARAPEAFRLGFATLSEDEITKAVTLFAKAKPDV